jgi:GNAT superfamily N-acetyltransferase
MIRVAGPEDGARLSSIVDAAYALYIPRIGGKPGPMLEDYADLAARRLVYVWNVVGTIQGLVVLIERDGYLLLDNIAVAPDAQGGGVGRRLMAFAEAEALRRGFAELRLYTNIKMTENLALYPRLGFEETGRARQDGFDRVFFRKRLLA